MNSSLKSCLICAASLALVFVSTGCRSQPPQTIIRIAPSLLPPERRPNVWLDDQVAPYAVGRYVDPRDRNVVHEAHTIYRREQSCRPNLTPPATLVIPPGEVASSSATNVAAVFRDALTAELNQQHTASQAVVEQSQKLQQQVRQLSSQAQALRDSVEESSRLRGQLQTLTNRLDQLEKRLREAATPVPPSAPSKRWWP